MMNKRFFIPFFLILILSLVALGCSQKTDNGQETKEGQEDASQDLNLVEEGKLTFAMSGLYKPFNYMDGGELKGFDVEVGIALAEKLGLEPNPVTTPWESIIQSLQGKKFDIILGSMAITKEREKTVNFTSPYYYSGGQIFVSEDNDEINSPEDLEGKVVGVVTQSTYHTAAQEYTDQIRNYSGDVAALQDLQVKGRLDAVITAPVVGLEARVAGLKIKPVGELLWVEQAAIALRKEDEALRDALNVAIEGILADGTYEKISTDLFGENLLDVNLEGVTILE